jgi:hypothetical protein
VTEIADAVVNGFFISLLGVIAFNCAGMAITTWQMGDFLNGKRDDLFSPPPLEIYLGVWLAAWLLISLLLWL